MMHFMMYKKCLHNTKKNTKDEGTDHSRNTSTSKIWLFVDKNLNYKDYACNGCHNLLMMAYSLDNIVILHVNVVFFWLHFIGN